MTPTGPELPTFPWDIIAEQKNLARGHPDGIVDLSVGTPVDPVSPRIREALASVSEVPGYPATHGTPELRTAAVDALWRRHGVTGIEPDAVLPTIGSKEMVAWLPTLLGVGGGDRVAFPGLSYPTFDVGVRLAGAVAVRTDDSATLDAAPPALLWLNSPSNPTGKVLGLRQLRETVQWARSHGVIVVSDECYLALGWDTEPVSLLHPEVHGGDTSGLLALHSLSKTASLAGYRAGFVTGDPRLVQQLLDVRKHAGMIVPRPVQEAMRVALGDDDVLREQRQRYAARRETLAAALRAAGFRIDHSEAGLYLWATRGEDSARTVDWLAHRGILVAPGTFYGPAGSDHVRVALTATDERVDAAAQRLRR